jgi:Tetracyclin repressor-like, C-terminal domain
MMISSFCVFRIANRHTFQASFGRDVAHPTRRDHYRPMLSDMVVDYLAQSGLVSTQRAPGALRSD